MAGPALGVQGPGNVLDLRVPELVAWRKVGPVGAEADLLGGPTQERRREAHDQGRARLLLLPDV